MILDSLDLNLMPSILPSIRQALAALAETKKTQDIVDITNQSSKEGIRIVIELRKDADVENFTLMTMPPVGKSGPFT